MALIVKTLAAGNANQSGDNTLYTVPPSKSAVVYNMRLVNAAATATTANLKVKPSNTGLPTARIYKKDHVLAVGAMLLVEDPLTLGQGDKVQLNLSGGLSANFTVNGVERDE
ncbi:MAG: hypothetical protein HYY24_22580 [Verrucomicrobia bacterium]|nr:hypothetical protein [Verrucomicrobiota bacterium]